jgi:hypothetical protein
MFMAGLFLAMDNLAIIGLILFAATAVFSLVTIPVEMDASKRAKQALSASGIAYGNELTAVDKVLDAAALTYVAGAVQALSTLLYYGMLFLGGKRRQ